MRNSAGQVRALGSKNPLFRKIYQFAGFKKNPKGVLKFKLKLFMNQKSGPTINFLKTLISLLKIQLLKLGHKMAFRHIYNKDIQLLFLK